MNPVIGFVLAVPLLAMVQSSVLEWVDGRVREAVEVGAGRKLVELSVAVEKHIHANYGSVTSGEISIATLVGSDLLPAGFGEGDAMKRELKVWALRNGDRIRALSMQAVPDHDDWWPGSGMWEASGEKWMGIVDGNGVLGGVGINQDVTDFQAVAGGDPKRFALAVLQVFDRQSVCGDYLFRRVRSGCPDGGVMETDLQLSGNNLEGVGRLEVENLEVSGGLEIGGDFRVDGELAVGRSVRVEGTLSVPGGVTFLGDAEFTGRVNANEVDVTGSLEADSADIGGDVTAASVNAGGNLTAAGATVTTVNAASGQIRVLSVGSCSGC